jgi:hypothetical protein
VAADLAEVASEEVAPVALAADLADRREDRDTEDFFRLAAGITDRFSAVEDVLAVCSALFLRRFSSSFFCFPCLAVRFHRCLEVV